jgi:hypothetical protein
MNDDINLPTRGYRYDVYVSYRRTGEWSRFVARRLLPMFSHFLDESLGRPSSIFFDEHVIQSSDQWPEQLATSLAASKILLCLWSKQYFTSTWCMAELNTMRARMELIKNQFGARPLIIAAMLHGELPKEVADIQTMDISRFANPWMAVNSPAEERLALSSAQLAESAAQAIEKAPPYDASWRQLSLTSLSPIPTISALDEAGPNDEPPAI